MVSNLQRTTATNIVGSSLLLATVMAFIFSWDQLGMQFTISSMLAMGILVVIGWQTKRRLDLYAGLVLANMMTLSVFVSIRAADFLLFLNVLFTLVGLAVVIRETVKPGQLRILDYIGALWAVPIQSLLGLSKLVPALRLKLPKRLTERQAQITRGVTITIPLLLIFGMLFASADAVFANLFERVFDINLRLNAEFVARSIFFVVVALLSAGLLAYTYLLQHHSRQTEENPVKSSAVELMIVLGSLNALFLLFIVIQAVYLFGGRDVVLGGDLTYAEYGRRGFFELLAVSFLTYVIAFVARQFLISAKSRLPQALMLALLVQVGIIMISAIKRLSLYEDVFGFTLLRFYSHSFIFFLAVAFAILGYTLIRRLPETRLLQLLFVVVGWYLITLNLISPDPFIARQNLDRYHETGIFDASYLRFLSADAIDQKLEALETVTENQPDSYGTVVTPEEVLCREKRQVENASNNHWSTFNVARRSASDALNSLPINCQP